MERPAAERTPERERAEEERPRGWERPRWERVELFEYPAGPHAYAASAWGGWAEGGYGAPPDGDAPPPSPAILNAQFEQRLEEGTRRAFEAGREQGCHMERQAQGAKLAADREQQKRVIAGLVESFAAERDRYLLAVEREVVRLALAVAARILRREAQMDPLLLTGAVRVALGQLSASTEVRLRVPASELELWTEAMALLPNLPLKPEVIRSEALRLGECLIETKLGTVDLGIRSQLAEIERGFFDRAGGSSLPSAAARNTAAETTPGPERARHEPLGPEPAGPEPA
ncbi:MAG TPA: FliH/SctL family protein [Terracidiphilus sp.]|jgi:flagellar assembly protein FliH